MKILSASQKLICLFATPELYEKAKGYIPQIKKEWFGRHEVEWQKILDCYMKKEVPLNYEIWAGNQELLIECIEQFDNSLYHLSKIESYIEELREERANSHIVSLAGFKPQKETYLESLFEINNKATAYLQELVSSGIDIHRIVANLKLKVRGQLKGKGISTPFRSFNESFPFGMEEGKVYTFAASKNTGKTNHAITIAVHAINNGSRVAFSSAENPAEVVFSQIVTVAGGISEGDAYNDPNYWERFDAACDMVEKWITDGVLVIIEGSELQLIRMEVMAFCSMSESTVLLVMDFFELYHTSWRFAEKTSANRAYEIHDIAKKCRVALLMLAQVLRASVKDGSKPSLGDIRWGEELETISTAIIILFAPDGQPYGTSILDYYLVKYRGGAAFKKFDTTLEIVEGGRHREPITTQQATNAISNLLNNVQGRDIVVDTENIQTETIF